MVIFDLPITWFLQKTAGFTEMSAIKIRPPEFFRFPEAWDSSLLSHHKNTVISNSVNWSRLTVNVSPAPPLSFPRRRESRNLMV
jgi:hypothetical protein